MLLLALLHLLLLVRPSLAALDSPADLMAAAFPTAVEPDIGTVSPQCFTDSRRYWKAFVNRQEWALSMYEASGKLLAGAGDPNTIMSTMASQGLFDQCIHQAVPIGNNHSSTFRGQFCTLFFRIQRIHPPELDEKGLKLKRPKVGSAGGLGPPYPALQAGFCLPSSCSARDLSLAVAHLVGRHVTSHDEKSSIVTMSDEDYCYTEDKILSYRNDYDHLDIAFLAFVGLLGLLIIAATLRGQEGGKLLKCFSASNNCKRIFSTAESPQDLRCIHGIRVLSTTWIVMYHSYHFATVMVPLAYNRSSSTKDLRRWTMQPFSNGFLPVDSFFLMTGILVTRSLFRDLENNSRNGRWFNPLLYYIRRYVRLTPVYVAIFGFVATLLAHSGSGPYWQNVLDTTNACRTNWLSSFLYINNLPSHESCIWQTWYLAADMQLFLFSPLFIYPLWRWSRAGFLWTVGATVTVLLVKVAIHIKWNLPPTFMALMRPSDMAQYPYYLGAYYFQAWTHLPQYLIGILIGWLLNQRQVPRLSQVTVAACWAACLASIIVVLYGLVPYLEVEEIPSFVKVTYGSFHQVAWVLAVGWIVFACTNGYGGFVNEFLSWKAFMPLARLSYGVYLIHYNFIRVYYAGFFRAPSYYSLLDAAIMDYLAIVSVSFGLAFVFSVAVELPFSNLDQLLLSARRAKKEPESDPSLLKPLISDDKNV